MTRREGEVVFANKGKVLFFSVWSPIARFDKAKAVFDEVLGTIEFAQAGAQEGDRLWSQEALFVRPTLWMALTCSMRLSGSSAATLFSLRAPPQQSRCGSCTRIPLTQASPVHS